MPATREGRSVIFLDVNPIPKGTITGQIAVWTGLAAGVAALLKLLWHPRSPFRRTIAWIWRRLVGEPATAKATGYLEALIARVVTPQIDAVHTEVADLSARNDAQHAENAAGIEAVKTAVAETNAKLAATNEKLATTNDTLANHILASPGLPLPSTGNERRRATDRPEGL
jgi:hypothetical protein